MPLQPLVSNRSTQAKNSTTGLGGAKDRTIVVGGGITGGEAVVVVLGFDSYWQ